MMKNIEPLSAGRVLSFQTAGGLVAAGWGQRREIEQGDVDVWGVTLEASDQCLNQCSDWLSTGEHVRAARFLRGDHRRRYILAHGTLRAVLSQYCGVAPASLEFQQTRFGKPVLPAICGGRFNLSFNLSHAAGKALIGVARGRDVGVDLEQVRDDIEAVGLAKRFFAETEHRIINSLPKERQRPAFFRYWVAKEAVLKSQGVGLRALASCEVEFVLDGEQAQVLMGMDLASQSRWLVHMVPCGSGWEGAVAAMGSDWKLKYIIPCEKAN